MHHSLGNGFPQGFNSIRVLVLRIASCSMLPQESPGHLLVQRTKHKCGCLVSTKACYMHSASCYFSSAKRTPAAPASKRFPSLSHLNLHECLGLCRYMSLVGPSNTSMHVSRMQVGDVSTTRQMAMEMKQIKIVCKGKYFLMTSQGLPLDHCACRACNRLHYVGAKCETLVVFAHAGCLVRHGGILVKLQFFDVGIVSLVPSLLSMYT